MNLAQLAGELRASKGFAHKRDIADVMSSLARSLPEGMKALAAGVPVGDDCAAIADGEGYLLFAIEGFVNEFVAAEPWFAGYCGVMVNISDIAAMGGRPTAIVDALWSQDGDHARPMLEGMATAASAYGVPIVGGHSNTRSDRNQLSVAILGRAKRLLTSFDAQPGDRLVVAVDLRGRYREPYAYWDASTSAPPERLRADLNLLPLLAEAGLCRAGKDISMAGAVGTALMLLECSGLGAVINVRAIPRPAGAPLLRWLTSFPSFGYILAVSPAQVRTVVAHFLARDIACAEVGMTDASGKVRIADGAMQEPLWDFRESLLIGCGTSLAREAAHAH
ncbi:MAG: sll0787 family AIR synthase-like protein [Betaproteobacteria bacterium]|nr:sll0787 family AIR synthase-like protein [Betaproteobacteria bacterium]